MGRRFAESAGDRAGLFSPKVDKWVSARRGATHRDANSPVTPPYEPLGDRIIHMAVVGEAMRLFCKRKAKTAVPLTAIADLRAAQWSGLWQLTREGFERNAAAYRCVRMISEAAASGGRPVEDG